jgi:hypothetical protein
VTAMYRLVPGGGFVCVVRDGSRIVAEEKHVNVGVLMEWKCRVYPQAVTVNSLVAAAPRPRRARPVCALCAGVFTEVRQAS